MNQSSKNTLWPDYHLDSKEQMFTAEEVNDFVKSAVELAYKDGYNARTARNEITDEDIEAAWAKQEKREVN